MLTEIPEIEQKFRRGQPYSAELIQNLILTH